MTYYNKGFNIYNLIFSSTICAVTGFWYESTDAKGLVGELTVDTKAARHGDASGAGAALAEQAQLERANLRL
uniref:Uncharacterized protein n=1 Tax=Cannabis sativa TaxID=3483 RepID=A0A803QWI4_CANSA